MIKNFREAQIDGLHTSVCGSQNSVQVVVSMLALKCPQGKRGTGAWPHSVLNQATLFLAASSIGFFWPLKKRETFIKNSDILGSV